MRWVWFVCIVPFVLSASDGFSVDGYVADEYISYSDSSNEHLISLKLKLAYKQDDISVVLKPEMFYSTHYNKRRELYLNEAYMLKSFDSFDVALGKSIKYWGALEGFNITDIFNAKNISLDMFDKDQKLGSYFVSGTYFGDDFSIEIGAKLYEEKQDYVDEDFAYYLLAFAYDKQLQTTKNAYTPSLYLKYSFSTDEMIESETSLIFWHGYDNKRDYRVDTTLGYISQYAYQVNKYMLYSTILYDGYVFKFEGSYSDVLDDSYMSDYTQLAFGVEKEIYTGESLSMTLYTEYYRYIYQDKSKMQNVDISEIYNHDIFVATKVSFNDTGSSEVKFGVLYDTKDDESILKLEAKSRIKDEFVLSAEVLHILDDFSLYPQLGGHTRLKFGVYYYF